MLAEARRRKNDKERERQRQRKAKRKKDGEREREREAGRGLLFRLLESRLVSEAGGQSETCFHGRPGCWSTNPAASCREHATSRVVEHLLLASRVAPVFPSVETFYATFPTTPLLSFLLFVCLYVCPSVCPSVAAFIYASVARESLCFAREPCTPPTPRLALLFLPFRHSTAASFHQRRAAFSPRFSLLAVASMEREAPTAAHTCSHLSPDTGEGHGPAGSNEHASPYYRDFLI